MDKAKVSELKVKYAESLGMDAGRAERAQTIVEANLVSHLANGNWQVRSENDERHFYQVHIGDCYEFHRCNCVDFEKRHLPCKHILAAMIVRDLPAEPKPERSLMDVINELSAAKGLPPLVFAGA